MKNLSPRHFLTASGLAIAIAASSAAFAQAPATQNPQEAANNNQPLAAPNSEARREQVMPETFADLVDQVSPAVVNITTTSTVSSPLAGGLQIPEGSPFSDLFREFGFPGMPQGPDGQQPFGRGGPQQEQRSNALGSGFVVSADGLIVTNNHVIDGADEIEIEFFSGKTLPAKVVGKDEKTDIAVLKVESADPLPFVKFGDSDRSRVGDWVLALGNPLGQGFSASTGIVSARNRALSGTYDDFIQTDAAINRGNSGGPLFNMDGEVIGVNTAILSPNGGSIGIGFSMASNVVSKVVEQLEEFGETRRGWLGVKIQPVTQDIAESLGLANADGAMVTDVPEGPALDAGMKAGDVITSFAGGEVKDPRDLVRRVADAPVGEAVDVTVQRDGKPVDLKITLGRRELAEGGGAQVGKGNGEQSGSESTSELLGMSVVPMTPEIAGELGVSRDMTGLVVQSVDPEGAAADKGLTTGDVITEAGQQPVTTLADLEARIKDARDAGRKSILMMVRRAGEPRFVALPVQQN
ncbi:DegQ family serine endoprotease [Paracoccus laeviglucosivorans]|uniref:Probable periplasmic serine endoprotease DegP-like n=1 Tax=Paracoccus laeviglucosivorans TaxID=1197861 RepID=A0A521BWB9_9RHOB|nr:DegQ family serine endoprotease [Paracoccus laeviglucosivorans]SMO51492.1 serine protease Do [Paracoccus laeviglucosivorans]